ncbi:exostosin family protein [uncultured Thiodictyon sp.]|uniref:exostosin domain-containing protein n=1 Tax=uncultured Thiodictyon sp. TaxID=1846217 RepID=UPI0025DEBF48|nr:exostosin family protein [uncultured Thiodictyon sp.]
MRFCTATHHADAATTRGSRDLARTYLQIVKTHSNDAVFDHIDAPELIVAATQIPLPILSNPLIKCGAADFRRIAARTSVKDEASEQSLAAPESIPKPALAAPQAPGKQATATSPELVRRDGLLAFPHYWQVPAATEMFAYQAIAALPPAHTFEYIGLPWATIIDGLRHDAASTGTILMALSRICEAPAAASKRVTVAQHIHAIRFIALFKACGITDLFWSHATHQQHEIDGIQLHPFPLFPAQTPDAIPPRDLDRSRRYLANFIGAYDPQLYLSNVREAIFNDPNAAADLLIVKRDAWHFDRAVYDEQIGGRRADPQCLLMERRHTQEYLNGIGNSWFTLCPSGAGPNSIRIFESLCLGSIPIVLTRDLRLPGPQALWEKAAIVEDDSAHGYARAIALARRLSRNQRLAMLESGQMLFRLIRPSAYGEFLHSAMADDGSR